MLQMSMWTLKSSIFFLSADGTLLHTLLQCGIPRNNLSAMTILSLRMESFCSVGIPLSHVSPECFSMEESTILLFVESRLL